MKFTGSIARGLAAFLHSLGQKQSFDKSEYRPIAVVVTGSND
ncbi:hypothetical protein PALA23_01593 [Pseudomonas aeruginosa]|nr:hypothetical protein PALA23_01593 [Pseudomonas aeruginosa]